ncbi:ABC transporter family substrate-binding protein [Speluncibacter jeojiensis]|uniref:ABC transporter family substrate-binding protein n=1 Tax=Speluncibacter jeojiensis TaxID=2710754 RepID=UPI0038CD515D
MLRAGLIVAGVLALAACTANPPPPIQSTDIPVTTTPTRTKTTVTVAIDSVGRGFNPHLLADLSPTNTAVASLVLPSPFRPVAVADHPGQVRWEPDPTVLVSAGVTSQSPFTVTYQLRTDAQWSDGAPIAVEDFRYLWQQMISQPGVVNPAGYAQISDVKASGEGGKTVSVVFRQPYPAWPELFTDLLPSHLVKDSPGGFNTGLKDTISVSGSRFQIKSVDRGRDEILLERNDRFWGSRVDPDQILLRRGGTAAQVADSLRTDDAQVAQVHGGEATEEQLAAIPGVHAIRQFQPRLLSLTLNTRTPALNDINVRRGLMGLLDAGRLATIGAGSVSGSAPDRAQTLAPSDPGYAPTAPPPISHGQALADLATSGYTEVDGKLLKDGKPLKLVIGVPAGDDTAGAVASSAADMLRGAGIDATVAPTDPEQLYGLQLNSGAVGAIVGWSQVGGDPATSLESRFGCFAANAARPPGLVTATAQPTATPNAPTPTTGAPTPTVTDAPSEPLPPPSGLMPPSNLSGACDPAVQPDIDAALQGQRPIGEVLPAVEPALWNLAAVLPILQDTTVAASGPTVAGVSLDAPVAAGVFADASGWTRTPR